ncbi:nitroreductase family protein [Streptomyces nojiriensis]|uniref:nitroreductase family protein n=1 Tax=Streptomyces nojiriensis TaxID=66374 RepID=UPI0035D89979
MRRSGREVSRSTCGRLDGIGPGRSKAPELSSEYRHPRASRVSLLNAGHLGRTLALTATALGPGPFRTAAFDDTAVESRLGLDSATHSVLYALAAGHPHPDRPDDSPDLDAFRRTTLRQDLRA